MTCLKPSIALCLLFSMMLSLVPPAPAQSQPIGTLAGRVSDEIGKGSLIGANVAVDGTLLSTETGRTGAYQILRVPAGRQKITISYLGYDTVQLEVNVTAGGVTTLDAALVPSIRESVTIREPILEGQARALNLQKNALNIQSIVASDQIGRFPDPNAAEAAQRIPGVTIERDQGEGRYVQVRGTESRLNSMQINGERIPSPEGDVRAVALDVVPADLLESIEVSKALTADMDADSIGGTVNLVTKGAPEQTGVSLTVGGGYNNISDDYLQTVNGLFGRRFFDNRLGLIVAGSFFNTDRGSENFEVVYDDGDLSDLQLRDYTINRKRYGFNTGIDYRFSPTSEVYLRGIFNEFNDQEFRRRTRFRLGNRRIERELKDRFESQIITSFSGGGRHLLPNFFQIDYRLTYSYAEEEEPNRVDTTFRQSSVNFAPNVTPTTIDPDNIQANPLNENVDLSRLSGIVREDNFTSDRDFTASFNGALPLPAQDNFAGQFKFGAKYRRKKKFRNNDAFEFSRDAVEQPAGRQIFLRDFLDTNFNPPTFLDGRYTPGNQFVAPGAARSFLAQPGLAGEEDFAGDAADFFANENVTAAYAMTELNLGENFKLLPGLRYEHTRINYTGYQVLFDDDGDFFSNTPVSGTNSYGQVLPSVHAVYRLTDNSNLRAAFTRTLARPNYSDLAPFQLILVEDNEIELGNPNLDVTTAYNFDVLAEHYFSTVGILSGGFFYKRLNDYIFDFTLREQRTFGGITDFFDVTQPLNGESASLYGFEVALQKQLGFLPAPLDGLGLYFNYTFVDSDTRLPSSDPTLPGRASILPGQAKHVGNLALSYEKFGFSGRASLHYRDRFLSEVASSPTRDIYFDNHMQLDISASQRLNKRLRLFVELNNLTNEPLRRYEGFRNRPVQEEFYSWWGTFGLKIDF